MCGCIAPGHNLALHQPTKGFAVAERPAQVNGCEGRCQIFGSTPIQGFDSGRRRQRSLFANAVHRLENHVGYRVWLRLLGNMAGAQLGKRSADTLGGRALDVGMDHPVPIDG